MGKLDGALPPLRDDDHEKDELTFDLPRDSAQGIVGLQSDTDFKSLGMSKAATARDPAKHWTLRSFVAPLGRHISDHMPVIVTCRLGLRPYPKR
jgi:hypothetical protein